MPSTRSTSSSEDDKKPNTRSKGGSKSSPWHGGKSSLPTSTKSAKTISKDNRSELAKTMSKGLTPKKATPTKTNCDSNSEKSKFKVSITPVVEDVNSEVPAWDQSLLLLNSEAHSGEKQQTTTTDPPLNKTSPDPLGQSQKTITKDNSDSSDIPLSSLLDSKVSPSKEISCVNGTVFEEKTTHLICSSENHNTSGNLDTKVNTSLQSPDKSIEEVSGTSSPLCALSNEICEGEQLENPANCINNEQIFDSVSECQNEVADFNQSKVNEVSNINKEQTKEVCDNPTTTTKSNKSTNKMELVQESPEGISVRKSGRRSIPNRKYLDMETDFSLKKSKSTTPAEKKTPKSPQTTKTSKAAQNSGASHMKRKLDITPEKITDKKIKLQKDESVDKLLVKKPCKTSKSPLSPPPISATLSKKPEPQQNIVSLLDNSMKTPPSSVPTLDSTPQINLDNTSVITVLKDADEKVSNAMVEDIVQSFSPCQMEKVSDLIMTTSATAEQSLPEVQSTITTEAEAPCAIITTNTLASFHVPTDNSVALLSKEISENIQIFQNIQKDAKLKEDQIQVTLPPPQIHEEIQNQKSVSKSLEKSDSKTEHVIIVHQEQQLDQSSEFLIGDKELIQKDLCETTVNNEFNSVGQFSSIPTVALQNSIPSSVVEPSYDVEVSLPSAKPIITFAEQLPHTSPYTVSLLNNSNKDKEAVESLMNETSISEKVLETPNVMMCLSSSGAELVSGSMTLDVATHDDAERLETEAAIQEITASFTQSFNGNDIVVTSEKDTIPKSSLSLAEAAKMVAESQTIVDLQEEVTLPISSLTHCAVQQISDTTSPITSSSSNGVPPTAVASTQTPLQLPRKGGNSAKVGSIIKSLPLNASGHVKLGDKLDVEDDCNDDDDDDDDDDEEEDEEEEDDDEEEEGIDDQEVSSQKLTQEFIIVHLPEGTQIKRQRVDHRSKEESLVGVRVDVNGCYKCTECDYCTVKKVNWYKHRKKHLGLRPHSCIKCNYKATTSSNLKRHMAIHADLREYKCNQCSHYFRQKIHLERHMKYKHEEKKIRCPLCTYVCANENPDLKIHIKRRHVSSDSTDGAMQAFTCAECGLVTMSKKDLKQHAKFHRKGPELKLFCEQCSFVTDCESRLRRHVLTHTKVKPFKCGLCEYRGSQKEHVLRHMKSRHSIDIQRNPRRQREDENSLDNMERDKGDFTSRDKIFACNHCTMKFSKLINLYKHLHTQHKTIMPSGGQNEFYCVVCDFKTINKKNLLVHMRKHNMQEQNPPSHVYSCVLCRYVNPKRRNLFQHMMKKHGIEIVMNMKDDWSSSCFIDNNVPTVHDKGEANESNVMAVNNVTTTGDDGNQLMVVTDDSGNNPVQTVITIEDLASSMTKPVKMTQVTLPPETGELSNKQLTDDLTQQQQQQQQQHAADAVEGLQALAEQPGIVESEPHSQSDDNEDDVILEDEDIKTESVETEDLCNPPTIAVDAPALVLNQLPDDGEVKDSVELSSEQIVHLSPGDFVEINGELYKVEISTEPAEETVTTTGDNGIETVPVTAAAVSELFGAIPNYDTTVTVPPASSNSTFVA